MKQFLSSIFFSFLFISFKVSGLESEDYLGAHYPLEQCEIKNSQYKYTHNLRYEIPKAININMQYGKKWYLKFIKTKSERYWRQKIPIDLKNYHDAQIKVIYPSGISCNFIGKVRINGSSIHHISKRENSILTSLRVKLINGSILGINNFKLFLPSTKSYDNEIFVATLFEELKFISPLTFYINSKINKEDTKFIFQANINKEYLKLLKIKPGIILSGNKIKTSKDVLIEN